MDSKLKVVVMAALLGLGGAAVAEPVDRSQIYNVATCVKVHGEDNREACRKEMQRRLEAATG